MSYILDALRRANAERERGLVPTLNTNPGPADLSIDEDEELRATPAARAGGTSPAPWLLAGGVIALAAAGGWVWLGGSRSAPTTPAPLPPVALPAAPAPALPPAATAPAAAVVPLQVPPQVEPMRAPAPSPAAPPPTPTRDQLPAALRQQLPPLNANGAMYSDTPANRMVILNGQLFHEGDKVAPELVLEEIRLKSAVLSFKGQRFTIGY